MQRRRRRTGARRPINQDAGGKRGQELNAGSFRSERSERASRRSRARALVRAGAGRCERHAPRLFPDVRCLRDLGASGREARRTAPRMGTRFVSHTICPADAPVRSPAAHAPRARTCAPSPVVRPTTPSPSMPESYAARRVRRAARTSSTWRDAAR